MAERFCPRCGDKIEGDYLNCPVCGASLIMDNWSLQQEADKLYEEDNFKKALPLYKELSKDDSAKNLHRYGYCLWKENKDYALAFSLIKRSAELGYAPAENSLGCLYDQGHGVSQDHREAAKWFRKAAERGYADSQNNLGICYDDGEGVKQDHVKAAQWYRKAANQGHATAQYNLGVCYYEGEGVARNPKKAAKWYRKAAKQGNALAQNSLGACYEEGIGVIQSDQMANMWYRKAAKQGDAIAQYNLGTRYFYGKNVDKNYEKAVKWFKKAAKQGEENAMKILALCYEKGYGVPINLKEADKWRNMALNIKGGIDNEKEEKIEEEIKLKDKPQRGTNNAYISSSNSSLISEVISDTYAHVGEKIYEDGRNFKGYFADYGARLRADDPYIFNTLVAAFSVSGFPKVLKDARNKGLDRERSIKEGEKLLTAQNFDPLIAHKLSEDIAIGLGLLKEAPKAVMKITPIVQESAPQKEKKVVELLKVVDNVQKNQPRVYPAPTPSKTSTGFSSKTSRKKVGVYCLSNELAKVSSILLLASYAFYGFLFIYLLMLNETFGGNSSGFALWSIVFFSLAAVTGIISAIALFVSDTERKSLHRFLLYVSLTCFFASASLATWAGFPPYYDSFNSCIVAASAFLLSSLLLFPRSKPGQVRAALSAGFVIIALAIYVFSMTVSTVEGMLPGNPYDFIPREYWQANIWANWLCFLCLDIPGILGFIMVINLSQRD